MRTFIHYDEDGKIISVVQTESLPEGLSHPFILEDEKHGAAEITDDAAVEKHTAAELIDEFKFDAAQRKLVKKSAPKAETKKGNRSSDTEYQCALTLLSGGTAMERQQGAKAQQAEPARGAAVAAAQTHSPEQTPEQKLIQLQQSVGNRAVGHLLGGRLPAESPSGHPAGGSNGDDEGDGPRAVQRRMRLAPSPSPFVQRKCACGSGSAPCAKCGDEAKQRAQLKPENGASSVGPDSVSTQSPAANLGAGRPLDAETRAFFEPRFGYDFAGVRVHDDTAAEASAHSMHALAYTFGHQIVFRGGQYSPTTDEGRRLLGHELAHVVQQSGGASGVQTAGLGEDDYEREADSASERALAGLAVGRLTPVSAPLPQGKKGGEKKGDDDKDDDEDEPPFANMEAALDGLIFTPPTEATYRKGPKLPQIRAIYLRRLLGDQYKKELVPKAGKVIEATPGYTDVTENLKGDAAESGKEKVHTVKLYVNPALALVNWLRSGDAGEPFTVYISDSQMEMLTLGVATGEAWTDLLSWMKDKGKPLPAWYTFEIFRQEMASQATLLRLYDKAKRAKPGAQASPTKEDAPATLEPIYDALIGPAKVLEAVRADGALTLHEEYPNLWPSTKEAWEKARAKEAERVKEAAKSNQGATVISGEMPATAPPQGPVSKSVGPLFLSYVRTQPVLAKKASDEDDVAGYAAREELLNRFGRFSAQVKRITTGEQRLLDSPGLANYPPFPSRLSAYPELQPPFFDATMASDHAFTMSFQFSKFFEHYTLFRFTWDMFRIPDERFINTATLDEQRRVEKTWGDIYGHRFARDSRYHAADVERINRHMSYLFGPPGMTVDMADLNAMMRYAGTGISTFFQQVTEPSNVKHYTFDEEGLYVVRCKAYPVTSENAEIVRPPSVDYLPVFARDPQMMGSKRVWAAVEMQEATKRRRDELESLLLSGVDVPNRAELEDELRAVWATLGTVGETLTYQKQTLELEMAKLPEGKRGKHEEQIERLEEMIKLRKDRGLTDPERLIAYYIPDVGAPLQLLLEILPRHGEKPPPYKYYVSDVTTPDSDDEEPDKEFDTRPKAIMSTVVSLLEDSDYGRGAVSVYIDGQVYSEDVVHAKPIRMAEEALNNIALIGSLIAVAAAPFTGGASLAALVPLGMVGAIPSAYHIVRRVDNNTFRMDLNMAMDFVNIAASFIGLGAEGAASKHAAMIAGGVAAESLAAQRVLLLANGLAFLGLGAGGAGVILMGTQLYRQLKELESLPPGLRTARMMEILGQALMNIGIQVGESVMSKARVDAAQKSIGGLAHFEGVEPATLKALQEHIGQNQLERLGGDAVKLLLESHTPADVKHIVERIGENMTRELVTRAGKDGMQTLGVEGMRDLVNELGQEGVRRLLKDLEPMSFPERALRVAWDWAANVIKLPAELLWKHGPNEGFLDLPGIQRLRQLAGWILERLAAMSAEGLRVLLGCDSPCAVDIEAIKKYFSQLAPTDKAKAQKLTTKAAVLSAIPEGRNLKGKVNTQKIAEYLTTHKAIMALIEQAGITDLDLANLRDYFTAADTGTTQEASKSAYNTFIRYLTQMLASKLGNDIGTFNRIWKEVVGVEPRQASAMKGPSFEAFVRQHVPYFQGKNYTRATFTKGKKISLKKTRTSDFFIPAVEAALAGVEPKPQVLIENLDPNTNAGGELWDFKHTEHVDPKQAADYENIQKHTQPDLPKVGSINYLFPSWEWANQNKFLVEKHGFNVYYLDANGVMQKYVPNAPKPAAVSTPKVISTSASVPPPEVSAPGMTEKLPAGLPEKAPEGTTEKTPEKSLDEAPAEKSEAPAEKTEEPGAEEKKAEGAGATPAPAKETLTEVQKVARALVAELVKAGKKVIVNIGGTGAKHEPQDAINVNNQAVGRKDIPNLVLADGSDIGTLFEANSVDRIDGYNMAPGVVDWTRAAPGAHKILKSGSVIQYAYRGANADAKVAVAQLLKAGFTNAVSMGDALVVGKK